jgi:HK97 family phage major capsid protein
MEFNTIQDAFNHYRTSSLEDIEKRAAEIKRLIETDPNANIDSLNIEIGGLQQAKDNIQETRTGNGFNPITQMSFNTRVSEEAASGDVFASEEYRSAFYKKLLGRDLTPSENTAYNRACETMVAEKRADAFSSSGSSSAVLPTLTLNEIINKARTTGGLISVCRGFNLPEKLSVPVATPSSNAQWHTEGAKVDSDDPAKAIVNVSFDGHEILKIFSISAKVRRMSIQAFEQYLVDELVACVMGTIENSLVNGTGSGQGTGLEKITWTPGNNAVAYSDTLKYTDVVAAMALLKRGYSAGASWAMNNATLYTRIYGIVDDNKRPIFVADPKNEHVGHILGKPIVIDDNIASGDIYLGDFKHMGYNLAEAPLIEVSRESSFNRGLIDYRALAIADTKPIVEEAFVKMFQQSPTV